MCALRDRGLGETSCAVGLWDGEIRIAARGNRWDGRPCAIRKQEALDVGPYAGAARLSALNLTDALLSLVIEQHAKLNPQGRDAEIGGGTRTAPPCLSDT